MPEIEDVQLKDLLVMVKSIHDRVAWAHRSDDAWCGDGIVLMASILRQIYSRISRGFHIYLGTKRNL